MATAQDVHQALDACSHEQRADRVSVERRTDPRSPSGDYRALWQSKYDEARTSGVSAAMARYQANQRVLAARAAECGIRL